MGIGISSKTGLKKKKIIDSFRFFIASRYKGVLLYSQLVADYYINNSVDEKKVFVANNTIKVPKPKEYISKPKDILFIGTVNERKKLDDLLIAFFNILPEIDKDICLNVVGDGPMLDEYINLVENFEDPNRVIFHGRIESSEELEKLFSKSLLSVSLGQAGLSILHSFSFGVPFMSYKTAINGGELENIENLVTGCITEPDDLEKDLISVLNSPKELKKMGSNCYKLYWESRTVEHFANSFIKAFE